MLRRVSLWIATPLLLSACSDGSETPEATPAEDDLLESPQTVSDERAPSIEILDPVAGVTVDGPEVTVTLGAEGVGIVPAGDQTPQSGHHHIFLDADLSPVGQPIPSVEDSIIHIGDGSSSYTFSNVAPGEHRLIAVLGDWQHRPVQPWVVDTVMITVR